MESSTVSPKYQIVIPKQIRDKLNLKPGQRVYLTSARNGVIKVDTRSRIEALAGKYKGVWGDNPDKYICELRDEWAGREARD